jgi:hypothetical protein
MTTSSFNPIIRVDEVLPWWMFPRRPAPTPNAALVLMRQGYPDQALTVGGKTNLSWREWMGYQSMVWVDISERLLQLECPLPTKSLGLDFHAAVTIKYKVNKPLEIVRWRNTNPRAEIETQVMQRMHEISRRYTMFECAAAEKEMRNSILGDLASGDVVVTRCIITLDVEHEERDYARKERAAERNYLYSLKNAAYRKDVDPLDTELDQRMIAFYNKLAQPGYAQFLLLHLASNRDQVQLILAALNEQRQLERDHWLKMLEILRQNGALEPSDWESLRTTVIARLTEADHNATVAAGSGNGSVPPLSAASVAGGGALPPGSGLSGGAPGGGPASPAAQLPSAVSQPASQAPLNERAVGDPLVPPPP